MSKVPEMTAYFWIVKVLTTALGESTSDYLVHVIKSLGGLGIGSGPICLVMAALFVCVIWYLAATRKDVPTSAMAPQRTPA